LRGADRQRPHLCRWEQGELTVPGPAWLALEYLLRERNEIGLADKVGQVVQQRRRAAYPQWAIEAVRRMTISPLD